MVRLMQIIFGSFITICLVLCSCSNNDTGNEKPAVEEIILTTTRGENTTTVSSLIVEKPFIDAEGDYFNEQAEYDGQIKYFVEGIKCDPIDKSLDCEKILLEKADILHTLIYKYLNNETDKLAYKYGEICTDEEGIIIGAKIDSDEMSTYADYKALFADSIYDDYFDYINTQSLSALFDINGVLCGSVGQSGLLGTDETWYLGYDVENDKIIGHFAELRGLGEPKEKTADYLNDEGNYWFYDITVQAINGEYVITDCHEISSGRNYDYFNEHGLYYNSGYVDRSLITNEAVKPRQ